MFRKEFSILAAIAGAILLSVGGASWLAVQSLHQTAMLVVQDTLPGLVDAGDALRRMQENWLQMHLVMGMADSRVRTDLMLRVEANSTEDLWRDYGRSITSEEDRLSYEKLTAARKAFLEARKVFFSLVSDGALDEARKQLQGDLTPAYRRYESAAEELFVQNARLGQARGGAVVNYARFAPLAIALLTTFLFLLGFVLGWHMAWSGPGILARLQKR